MTKFRLTMSRMLRQELEIDVNEVESLQAAHHKKFEILNRIESETFMPFSLARRSILTSEEGLHSEFNRYIFADGNTVCFEILELNKGE